MRIVIAPDSFKGSLSAREACEAVERGLLAVWPDAQIDKAPMADGGEGTVQALVDATGGEVLCKTVTGPMGKPVEAHYGILGDGKTGVIEMASASGLPLVEPEERNPLTATTYGTGELIRECLNRGCERLILGIGGSATNDGGAGMAQALGVRLLDGYGKKLGRGGGALGSLARIDVSELHPRAHEVEVVVACDVDNPLCGEHGASRVYGPQKGATPEMVERLDANLRHFAKVVREELGVDILDLPGAGAAGGLGGGLVAFLGATLRPGVEIVTEAVGLRERVKGADLVVTGEGKIDGQTVFGKTPIGVARVAKEHGIPVIAIAGALGDDADVVLGHGIDAVFSIAEGPISPEEAMRNAAQLLESASRRVARILSVGRGTELSTGDPQGFHGAGLLAEIG